MRDDNILAGLIDVAIVFRSDIPDQFVDQHFFLLTGVVLEKHLEQVCIRRKIKVTRKSIADMNEALKKKEIIDFPTYRQIGLLGELNQLCLQSKKREPEQAELDDPINGTDKIIRTVF